jgi:hypothetical protein
VTRGENRKEGKVPTKLDPLEQASLDPWKTHPVFEMSYLKKCKTKPMSTKHTIIRNIYINFKYVQGNY